MSTAELLSELQRVTPDELRAELAKKAQARDETLAQYDREMELIERLIDVVEPRPSRNSCSESPAGGTRTGLKGPQGTYGDTTGTVEVTRQEFLQSDPANVLGTLSEAIQPTSKPRRKKIETLLAKVVTAKDIRTYLDVSGPTAAGAIAHQFNCTREAITDILETDAQFVNDGRGFWDLTSRVNERREKELQPINQVY